MGNEISEFSNVSNWATFNRLARREKFPRNLDDVRIKQNEQADVNPSTLSRSGEAGVITAASGLPKYKIIRQHPDGDSNELNNEIGFA